MRRYEIIIRATLNPEDFENDVSTEKAIANYTASILESSHFNSAGYIRSITARRTKK